MADKKTSGSCESEYLIAYYKGLHEQWVERFYKAPMERLSVYLLALTLIATWSSNLPRALQVILQFVMLLVGLFFFYDLCDKLGSEDKWLEGLMSIQKQFAKDSGLGEELIK